MKENYEEIEFEVIAFEEEDIITGSSCDETELDN